MVCVNRGERTEVVCTVPASYKWLLYQAQVRTDKEGVEQTRTLVPVLVGPMYSVLV